MSKKSMYERRFNPFRKKQYSYRLHQPTKRPRGMHFSVTPLAGVVAGVALVAIIGAGAFAWHVHNSNSQKQTPANTTKPAASTPKESASRTATTVSDAKSLGFAAGSSLPGLSQQDLDSRLSGMAAAGATWVRFDFDWSTIQPNNSSSYNWSPYDRIVAAANMNHLKILGIIDYTPEWARIGDCSSSQCPPASATQYAHFATVLSQHYASKGVHDWEIWNEPNNPQFWQPADNAQGYVNILKAAYSALHAADSQAFVITAGLSPQADSSTSLSPVSFLTAMYNDGAQGYFDAVGDHPYTFPLTPTSDADDAWTQMAANTNSLRALMVSHGDGNKKIWITEFGSPTGGPGPVATVANPDLSAQPYVVDQGLQAKILYDAIGKYMTYSWAGPFFYYSYQDAGTDPSTNENFFGLIAADGTKKQAYSVFTQAAAALK